MLSKKKKYFEKKTSYRFRLLNCPSTLKYYNLKKNGLIDSAKLSNLVFPDELGFRVNFSLEKSTSNLDTPTRIGISTRSQTETRLFTRKKNVLI